MKPTKKRAAYVVEVWQGSGYRNYRIIARNGSEAARCNTRRTANRIAKLLNRVAEKNAALNKLRRSMGRR